jgi:hypothetical protein
MCESANGRIETRIGGWALIFDVSSFILMFSTWVLIFNPEEKMGNFIEYQLEDGTTILIQAAQPQQTGGITKASRSDAVGNVINSVNQKFADAFAGVKSSALVMRRQFEELQADEVEVTFGLTATGELGNFAIGQIGAEANYEITLKWSNKPAKAG